MTFSPGTLIAAVTRSRAGSTRCAPPSPQTHSAPGTATMSTGRSVEPSGARSSTRATTRFVRGSMRSRVAGRGWAGAGEEWRIGAAGTTHTAPRPAGQRRVGDRAGQRDPGDDAMRPRVEPEHLA